jgi:hypothetical protein
VGIGPKGHWGTGQNGGKLRRIWDDLLARIASSNLELELELETYRDRNRARARLARVLSLGGFTAEFGHRSSTSTSAISADKGEDEGEGD